MSDVFYKKSRIFREIRSTNQKMEIDRNNESLLFYTKTRSILSHEQKNYVFLVAIWASFERIRDMLLLEQSFDIPERKISFYVKKFFHSNFKLLFNNLFYRFWGLKYFLFWIITSKIKTECNILIMILLIQGDRYVSVKLKILNCIQRINDYKRVTM